MLVSTGRIVANVNGALAPGLNGTIRAGEDRHGATHGARRFDEWTRVRPPMIAAAFRAVFDVHGCLPMCMALS